MDDSTPSTSAGRDFFSRRPSLFGRNKGHKTTPSGLTRPTAVTPPPPQIDIRDVDPAVYESPPPSNPGALSPPRTKHKSRHSISSVTDIGTALRRTRSSSLRTDSSSATASSSHKRTPSATLALSFSPEKTPTANASAATQRPALSISTFGRNARQKSSENVRSAEPGNRQPYEKSPLSAVDNPKTPFGMVVPLRYPAAQKEPQPLQRQQSTYGGSYNGSLAPAAPISMGGGANPHIVFQHIHEMASKRISTLDYLRKAHEGRIYWFNTLLFAKSDLTRLPSFTPRNLARRATHYLLLGFSLPTILDLNANSPTDYLKALNALLLEFEQYQSIHPPDGSTPSSLSRGRIPQMFKRANVMGGKGRRSSSAADGFPILTPQNSYDGSTSAADSPPTDDLLLPNESYLYLQTPNLPFDPDFFSTFATLCDVLIDCYTKILSLLNTPESVVIAGGGLPSVVGDLFSKADAKVRKIILASVVREFEEGCRQGLRGEVGGVGKVVLGGLM